MTREQRDELRRQATAEDVSPSPWFVNERTGEICYGEPQDDRNNFPIDNPGDYAYIAAANPQAVLALLDALDEAEMLRDDARTSLENWHAINDSEVKIFRQEINVLAQRAEKAERERDQAKGELAESLEYGELMRKEVDSYAQDSKAFADRYMQLELLRLRNNVFDAERDRDAARAEADRLRAALEEIRNDEPGKRDEGRDREHRLQEIARTALEGPA